MLAYLRYAGMRIIAPCNVYFKHDYTRQFRLTNYTQTSCSLTTRKSRESWLHGNFV
jgi:hypothetical protein